MNTSQEDIKYGAALFFAILALSLAPAVLTLNKGQYAGVPPAYVDDDLSYYGRMKEVADGRPLISNPYFIEYQKSEPGTFSVADWLAAVPLLLGIPLSQAIVLNFLVWSIFFAILAYLLGRIIGVSPPLAASLALIAYVEVYWLIYRPVAMQQVFPFFLIFLLALIFWLRNPLRRSSAVFLVATSALSFYIYTFLWQIVCAILGVVILHNAFSKRWLEMKSLLWIALGTGLGALPALVYIFNQIQSPFYWDTVNRINMVVTRLPGTDAYYYGRWAVLLTVLYLCLRSWLPRYSHNDATVIDSVIYSGLGLLVASMSNVITSQDLSVGQHVGRFITLWAAIVIPVVMWKMFTSRKEIRELQWYKLTIIGAVSLASLGFLAFNVKRSLPFQRITSSDTVALQSYVAPLRWLVQHEQQPITVWANTELSMYIPILTNHYVFWAPTGGLFFMPTREVEDRFLASRMKALTVEELVAMSSEYDGGGVSSRYNDYLNKNTLRCLFGVKCSPHQSMRTWIGNDKLQALLERQKELRKNISGIMKEYHVAYVVVDTSKAEERYLESLPGIKKMWNNERFIIYKVI